MGQEKEREKWFNEERQQFQLRRELQERADDLTEKLMLAEEQLARVAMEQVEGKQEERAAKEKEKENENENNDSDKIRQQQARWDRKERQLLGGLDPGQDRPPFEVLHQLYQLRKAALRAKAKNANESGMASEPSATSRERPKSAAPNRRSSHSNSQNESGPGKTSARPKSAAPHRRNNNKSKAIEYCGSSSVNMNKQ